MEKVCSKCKLLLDESMFSKDITSKDGIRYTCRSCYRETYKNSRQFKMEILLEGEIWKDVVGWEAFYEVSNFGNVRGKEKIVKNVNGVRKLDRLIPRRPLKPQSNHLGYKSVNLYMDSKMTKKPIHRLVSEAFLPNPENKPCVNHKDFNPSNNHVDNLEWCTYQYNYDYSKERIINSMAKGEDHFYAKLTSDEVKQIKMLKGIMRNCDIARKFNVSPPVICDILNGKAWKHI